MARHTKTLQQKHEFKNSRGMAYYRSKKDQKAYEEGWERIFGKKKKEI